jgi:hypothetical protein
MLFRKRGVSEFNMIQFDALIKYSFIIDQLLKLFEYLIATEILE